LGGGRGAYTSELDGGPISTLKQQVQRKKGEQKRWLLVTFKEGGNRPGG